MTELSKTITSATKDNGTTLDTSQPSLYGSIHPGCLTAHTNAVQAHNPSAPEAVSFKAKFSAIVTSLFLFSLTLTQTVRNMGISPFQQFSPERHVSSNLIATRHEKGKFHRSRSRDTTDDDSIRKSRQGQDQTRPYNPNIVIIYLDDQGFNDMGRQSTDLSEFTPTIEGLRDEGIWFTNYYGQHVCTPSRATLLTGLYPIHTGMQHSFLSGNDPWGLPLEHKTLAEYLNDNGYQTHMVGKWHLGYFLEDYTPISRGFSTFFGYYSGYENYFTHVAEPYTCKVGTNCYYDLRSADTPVLSTEYNTYIFSREAEMMIKKHAKDAHETGSTAPFFLYFAMGNTHSPVAAPDHVFEKHGPLLSSIRNHERRVFAAATIVADEAVYNVTVSLKHNDLFEDTILIIASDNGGNPWAAGNNYPLRGMKNELWEGGMRVNALLRSNLIPVELRGTTYDNLFHVADWVPTLLRGALQDGMLGTTFDGINHWDSLIGLSDHVPRLNLVYNVDYNGAEVAGAIRIGDMKFMKNVQYAPVWEIPQDNYPNKTKLHLHEEKLDYLFNLTADPTESHDLSHDPSHRHIVAHMNEEFSKILATMVDPAFCGAANDTLADSVYSKTHFVGPFMKNESYRCIKKNSAEEATHISRIECGYQLHPPEFCYNLEDENNS